MKTLNIDILSLRLHWPCFHNKYAFLSLVWCLQVYLLYAMCWYPHKIKASKDIYLVDGRFNSIFTQWYFNINGSSTLGYQITLHWSIRNKWNGLETMSAIHLGGFLRHFSKIIYICPQHRNTIPKTTNPCFPPFRYARSNGGKCS